MIIKKNEEIKGIKIKSINILLMCLACILCIFIFIESFFVKSQYDSMIASMNDYAECNKAINEFAEASDYLTTQARFFSVNLDITYLHNYVDELKNVHRRENALQVLELSHSEDNIYNFLSNAYEQSNRLVDLECYNLCLIAEGLGLSNEEIPENILEIELSDKDKNLTPEQKIQEGKFSLFNEKSIKTKELISDYSSKARNFLISDYLSKEQSDDKRLARLLNLERIFIFSLFCVSIILFILLLVLVLHPLLNHNKSILAGSKMKYNGSYELKYIAKAYNSLLEKNEIKASVLKHKAEHDPLTGLINREAFNQIKKILEDSREEIAYLIIDIDLFKSINDTYGHITGDNVLKRISHLLMEQFRNTDYVARIGGDEFAVIMTKVGDDPEFIIQKKIECLNKTLQETQDSLPPVSLSVGVAFSQNGYYPALEENADKALYKVKKGGRCNCAFFN